MSDLSELAPVKARVEIFRGPPVLFDDHFCKGWTAVDGNQGWTGDSTTLTIAAGKTSAYIWRAIEFNAAVYKYWINRCLTITAVQWQVWVRRKSDGAWFAIAAYTGTGLRTVDISYFISDIVDGIRIWIFGTEGQSIELDYTAICKNTLLTPVDAGDVVEELTINRPVLSQGISGAKLTIPNFDGAFNGLISEHDVIIIWLARNAANLENPAYKAFGGRVIAPQNKDEKYGAFYIDLDCHGHEYELMKSPALIQTPYAAANGRTIIEDALNVCNYVVRHPTDSMWFDAGGASGSTDDRINSTHSVEYDEVTPLTVIQETLEKASNPAGVRRFDGYFTPSGVMVGHLRNSLDFVSPITSITPETYTKSEDILRINNKIKVYGAQTKRNPSDGDSWTESTTNWSSNATVSTDADAMAGNYSVKATGVANPYLKYTPAAAWNLSLGRDKPKELHVWVKGNNIFNLVIKLKSSSSAYFFYRYDGLAANQWHDLLLRIGPSEEFAAGWSKVFSPSWSNIVDIEFATNLIASETLKVDGLYFGKIRFSALAEDAASQTAYGVRMPEPFIDNTLKSDAECQARAEALRDFYKDPAVSLKDVQVDGDHQFNPGDRQRVIVANDNLDEYFAISRFEHKVRGPTWDTVPIMGTEPALVDQILRMIVQQRNVDVR